MKLCVVVVCNREGSIAIPKYSLNTSCTIISTFSNGGHVCGLELQCKRLSSQWTVFFVTRWSQEWTKSWLQKELLESSISAKRRRMINGTCREYGSWNKWSWNKYLRTWKMLKGLYADLEASNNNNVKWRKRQQL